MREPISLLWDWSSMRWPLGRKPFRGKQGKSGGSHSDLRSCADQGIEPSAPIALERALGKCLNKDPEERWQTARDLTGELKWILEDLASSGTSAASRTEGRRMGQNRGHRAKRTTRLVGIAATSGSRGLQGRSGFISRGSLKVFLR